MSRRLATVDVGSNSVTSLVAEAGADGVWRPLHEEARITRLGAGLDAGGRISDEALGRTLEVLGEMADRARALGAEDFVGVATAAAREATNGQELVRGAAEVGLRLSIISGEEEAGLSWLASWRGFGEAGRDLAVVDVGGRSTEVIYGRGEAFDFRTSLPLGSVRLLEASGHGGDAAPDAEARRRAEEAVAPAIGTLPPVAAGAKVVAVAGTATTLMAVHLGLERYDADRVHGTALDRATLVEELDRLWSLGLSERRALPGMEPGRADVLPFGALVLARTLDRLGAEGLVVSDRGVRWGLLYREA